MLREFKVKNFKNFKNWFIFNLAETKNYNFNTECIKNDTVSTGMIYGKNGCGKSNLAYAIFDIKSHLADNYNYANYNYQNYLNADSDADIAEFIYQFQFGDIVVEYAYGKVEIDKIVYEKLSINNKEVISLDRRENHIATVKLDGAENLNKDLGNSDISIVKYVKSNTALVKNKINDAFQSFYDFMDYMMFVKTVDSHKLMTYNPSRISEMLYDKNNDSIAVFEKFLNDAGINCKLLVIEEDGKKSIAFDYENKNIDFYQSASTGSLSLTELFIHLQILKIRIENLKLNHNDLSPFIFIDEFDAFYNHLVSKTIVNEVKKRKCQAIFTTHNTSIMSNDLLRPDCYFIMTPSDIKPVYKFTKKELRSAHNIEKMFRAGAFDE